MNFCIVLLNMETMMFKKYNSIENIDNAKLVDKVRYEGFADPSVQWIAQEKIHGANFSFMYDGKTLKCAKRSGDIKETESFFGYEIILAQYKKSVLDAWDILVERFKDVEEINIFGEFAGPGIQKEVDYEHKDFYAFDILVNGHYIDKEIVNETCKLARIKLAPIIRYGSFDELCNMERAFDTLVPKYNEMLKKNTDAFDFIFGEQEEGEDNISEGYVISPVVPAYLTNGNRVIFKCKNAKFKEKGKIREVKPVKELSESDMMFVELATAYITEQRLSNVISHIGEIGPKDFGKVMGLMSKDVYEDMTKDGFDVLETEDIPLVKKTIQMEITTFIRKDWVNYVIR